DPSQLSSTHRSAYARSGPAGPAVAPVSAVGAVTASPSQASGGRASVGSSTPDASGVSSSVSLLWTPVSFGGPFASSFSAILSRYPRASGTTAVPRHSSSRLCRLLSTGPEPPSSTLIWRTNAASEAPPAISSSWFGSGRYGDRASGSRPTIA